MPKTKSGDSIQAFLCTSEMLRAIERVKGDRMRERPFHKLSRADVIRELVQVGIDLHVPSKGHP